MAIVDFKIPETLIEDFALPGCTPTLNWEMKAYEFPCGLAVAKKLGDAPVSPYTQILQAAHEKHHKEGHPWACQLVQHTSYSEDHLTCTITVGCNHV